MVILPRKHPNPFNSVSYSMGVGLMGAQLCADVDAYFSQSEGNGRCKVPSACGSSIAVSELIEETYFEMLKKKEKNETLEVAGGNPPTR